jgi:hypothetical protein
MSVDTLTVVPQNSSGIPQFNRALSVGTCSPTTSAAVGNAPLIGLVFDYFSFTIFVVAGKFDNSSITSFTLTPSGGSTLTFNVNSFSYNSSANTTQWGSSTSYRNLVAGTTYTMQFFSGATNAFSEGTTLERRNPKDFNDFYGATRNVPPVSGAFKLSWLKNAVKYQWSSSLTAGQASVAPPASYTIRGYNGAFPVIGSMTSSTPSGIIGFYNGIGIQQLADYFITPGGSLPNYYALTLTFFTTQANPGVNSQWYKLQIGSAVFYRENATFAANPNSPYWTTFTWDNGSTQTIANSTTYAIKLTC